MTQEQIEKIHSSSLRILAQVGVQIGENDFLQLLSHNGANVDFKKKRVKMPENLVEACIKKTPKNVTLYAREPKHDVHFEEGEIYAHPVGGAANVIDVDSGKARPATVKDVEDITRLVDCLSNLHTQTMTVYPNDVPTNLKDVYAAEALIRNTGKNFDVTPFTDTSFRIIIELVEAVVGEEKLKKKPIITCSVSPTSPLQFSEEVTKIMIRAANHNLPIALLPCPLAGATSPITMAGALLEQNVEILAGVSMVQLLNRGNPVEYSPRCIPLNMVTGQACDGIEASLMSAGCVQLAKFYNLPSDVYGLDTDSKVLDEQVGIEKVSGGLLPALSGANALSGAGCLEGGITASYEQLVIDDEIFGMIFRAVKGIGFDEEKLGADIITKVVEESSNFLQQKHTLKHFRNEYFVPSLANRASRFQWEGKGSKNIVEIAREKMRRILAENEPPSLDEDVKKQLRNILKTAAKNSAT